MPSADEISEEGFGGFRGTWWIGRLRIKEAESTVVDEAELIGMVDQLASSPEEFELLASSIEANDLDSLPESRRAAALDLGIARFVVDDESPPLDGLEIGVAGLAHALAAIGCLTAASCRWHIIPTSWSDCPVVLFAAPQWRVELLADLVSSEGCGLGSDGSLLVVYGPSILKTHNLAVRILAERGRFRRMPDHWRARSTPSATSQPQLSLFPAPTGPHEGQRLITGDR